MLSRHRVTGARSRVCIWFSILSLVGTRQTRTNRGGWVLKHAKFLLNIVYIV